MYNEKCKVTEICTYDSMVDIVFHIITWEINQLEDWYVHSPSGAIKHLRG